MSRAYINPELMVWARHRRGLSTEDLSKKLRVETANILDWEAGERRPTFRQAQRVAQALYVPFGYLFLAEPPVEELPIPDFRTLPDQSPLIPSADLLDLLNDVLGKQQWYREYREAEGVEELPFVGRFKTSDSEEEVSADIRDVIDVEGARERAPNFDTFMRELTRNAESSGIMVLRSGVVGNNNHRPLNIGEFRGFSISDDVAPLIFINARDYRGAQIFTLAHEMAHIWSGQGGVSNPDYGLRSGRPDSSVEHFCNRVAAETLVPGEDFRSRWEPKTPKLDDSLSALSSHYKVSSMVILRQAHDHDFVPASSYWECYSRLVERAERAQQSSQSGGNFHYTLTARNGNAFTEAVVSSAAEGTLMSSEAADMLGVKIKTLPSIAGHLFGSPLNLG